MPRVDNDGISIITNLVSRGNKTVRNTSADKVQRTDPADRGTVAIAFEETVGNLRIHRRVHDNEIMEGKIMGSRTVWHDLEDGGS